MKSEFNKSWNSSVQPRKQVKFRANAPNHIKRKFMGCPLDKELKTKYGRRNIEVRKGDEVKVMRGKFKGKQGKVGDVDVKNTRLQIDGIQRVKKMGGEKMITWFHPSKVKIIILNMDDNRRLKTSGMVEIKETKNIEKKNIEKRRVKRVSKEKVEKFKKTIKEDKK
ncbi:50S ribosomal protein L24 [archaeon]|jgi:large subunit ribosomal protein L24|nr:50S ribosomal protein L24 [archaeon]MBT7128911.1 50S ribosomal protein L24 [archaeon]